MKKLLAILLICAITFSMIACTSNTNEGNEVVNESTNNETVDPKGKVEFTFIHR